MELDFKTPAMSAFLCMLCINRPPPFSTLHRRLGPVGMGFHQKTMVSKRHLIDGFRCHIQEKICGDVVRIAFLANRHAAPSTEEFIMA